MRYIIALSLALASLASQAGEVPYSFDRDIKQERIVDLYLRTRRCYVTAGKAVLRQGVQDEFAVLRFMFMECADGMRAQLVRDGTMNDNEAREWLLRLAHTTLYVDILHQPEPQL
jgi:hypothetical protein